VCKQGFAACGDICANTQSDDAHCGSCDIACVAPLTCKGGRCR
jgi:hypothetical protein